MEGKSTYVLIWDTCILLQYNVCYMKYETVKDETTQQYRKYIHLNSVII